MFFISIYLLSFSSPAITAPQSGPLGFLISDNSHGAAALEAARANKISPFWPRLFAIVSSPIMLAKQVINVLQLVNASRWLAEGDVEVRRRAGLPRRRKRE
jgi:CDP-diacylglycerol--inositol 3-phosphatidyltransferase